MTTKDFFKGHTFQFDKINIEYESKNRNGLLYSFLLLGLIAIPGIQSISKQLVFNHFEWENTAAITLMLGAFLLTIKLFFDFDFKILGLHPWNLWPVSQKVYVLQTVLIVSLLFLLLFKNHLLNLIESYSSIAAFIFFSVIPGIIWGMLQEFVYRGMLQNELVRKLGAFSGILLSNLIFTFGPLHFYYFNIGSASPIQLMMFLPIFGIGLLFGLLYYRSGNLWIPAIFHGLWVLNWQ